MAVAFIDACPFSLCCPFFSVFTLTRLLFFLFLRLSLQLPDEIKNTTLHTARK